MRWEQACRIFKRQETIFFHPCYFKTIPIRKSVDKLREKRRNLHNILSAGLRWIHLPVGDHLWLSKSRLSHLYRGQERWLCESHLFPLFFTFFSNDRCICFTSRYKGLYRQRFDHVHTCYTKRLPNLQLILKKLFRQFSTSKPSQLISAWPQEKRNRNGRCCTLQGFVMISSFYKW